MKQIRSGIIYFLLLSTLQSVAQTDSIPVFKGAIKTNRDKTYSNIVKNSITKNLSISLTDSTEENWEDAFYAMELVRYKQPWVNEKIKTAFENVEKRSVSFQRSLLELLYTNYSNEFEININQLFLATTNAKVFAMCAEFLLRADRSKNNIEKIGTVAYDKTGKYFQHDQSSSFIAFELLRPIFQSAEIESNKMKLYTAELLNNNFLKNNVVVYSFQRKNRNYPGIVMVKDTSGNFITETNGAAFFVPQLAKSITNLPGYLTNGNTPQGIFRMYGFDVSKSAALGPTENIQLTMPFETSVKHFLKDSSITDTVWTPELYERLLPEDLKAYRPLFGTFYASAIGRTEIIAHGTTVDPEYYEGEPYYPYTPTQGCLCTKEIWSAEDGKRVISDQQKLVDAIKKAGGADGYFIVIEIDDQQKPVSVDEIMTYLKIHAK